MTKPSNRLPEYLRVYINADKPAKPEPPPRPRKPAADLSFHDKAACRVGGSTGEFTINPRWWDDRLDITSLPGQQGEKPATRAYRHMIAKQICSDCPVRRACRADADTFGAEGTIRAGKIYKRKRHEQQD